MNWKLSTFEKCTKFVMKFVIVMLICTFEKNESFERAGVFYRNDF
jgi:hypothetical protein